MNGILNQAMNFGMPINGQQMPGYPGNPLGMATMDAPNTFPQQFGTSGMTSSAQQPANAPQQSMYSLPGNLPQQGNTAPAYPPTNMAQQPATAFSNPTMGQTQVGAQARPQTASMPMQYTIGNGRY